MLAIRRRWLAGFCQGSRQRLWPTRAGLSMSRLSQRGVDEDAVLGLRIGGGDRAIGAHRYTKSRRPEPIRSEPSVKSLGVAAPSSARQVLINETWYYPF